MTEAARNLLDAFEVLSAGEQREVVAALMRQALEPPYEASDPDLLAAADLLFQQLDGQEAEG